MPWPPGALPISRTNATPQETDHPNLHNLTSQAVNDTVTHVSAIDSLLDVGIEWTDVALSFPNGTVLSTTPYTLQAAQLGTRGVARLAVVTAALYVGVTAGDAGALDFYMSASPGVLGARRRIRIPTIGGAAACHLVTIWSVPANVDATFSAQIATITATATANVAGGADFNFCEAAAFSARAVGRVGPA